MLANNALTTLDRMKLMLDLDDEADERTCALVELLINKASGPSAKAPIGSSTMPTVSRSWSR